MNEVNVNVIFNYSGVFTDKNGKYCTCDGSYVGDYLGRVLSNFDSIAYVTCPKGTVGIYLQPVVDADDFLCYELQAPDSHDYMTLVEREDGFKTLQCEDIDFSHEVVEYLYDKSTYDEEIVWNLKKEIRNEIESLIDKNLEGYIEECGYKEIDDIDDWDW